jgi:hypothetical protein
LAQGVSNRKHCSGQEMTQIAHSRSTRSVQKQIRDLPLRCVETTCLPSSATVSAPRHCTIPARSPAAGCGRRRSPGAGRGRANGSARFGSRRRDDPGFGPCGGPGPSESDRPAQHRRFGQMLPASAFRDRQLERLKPAALAGAGKYPQQHSLVREFHDARARRTSEGENTLASQRLRSSMVARVQPFKRRQRQSRWRRSPDGRCGRRTAPAQVPS